jgi:hypothetical protein
MLACVALVAVALVVGTVLPSPRADDAAPGVAGLRVLPTDQRLIIFEDYSYGPGGWADGEGGLAPGQTRSVLRPDGPMLDRRIMLPDATTGVQISFDILGLSDPEQLDIDLGDLPMRVDRGASGPDMAHYQIDVSDPGRAIDLRLTVPPGSRWGIDNLLVVATVAGDDA